MVGRYSGPYGRKMGATGATPSPKILNAWWKNMPDNDGRQLVNELEHVVRRHLIDSDVAAPQAQVEGHMDSLLEAISGSSAMNARRKVQEAFGTVATRDWNKMLGLSRAILGKRSKDSAPTQAVRRRTVQPFQSIDSTIAPGCAAVVEEAEIFSDDPWAGLEKEAVAVGWLQRQCRRHLGPSASAEEVAALAASVVGLTEDMVRRPGELESALFELLGLSALPLIAVLVQRRDEVVDLFGREGRLSKLSADVGSANRGLGMAQASTAAMVSHALLGNVTVVSEKQRELARERRRMARARGTTGPTGQSADDYVRRLLRAAPGMSAPTSEPSFAAAAAPTMGKVSLPADSERVQTEEYEQVTIPAPVPEPMGETEALIPISQFDARARKAFAGFEMLNRIQSRVFKEAYHGSGNMLICAPTGAGKTNIAVMAMLREIREHAAGSSKPPSAETFKIVYVAPMKALAQEMVSNFSKRLGPLGVTVRELTGDMQLSKRELGRTHVIVTTPEKWDVITRKNSDGSMATLVRLLIIDEIHLLHEDRGPVLETLVARTQRLVESSQSLIRIVGLSATLPNYADVAAFLRVDPSTGLFFFDGRFRPVPLQQQFIGVKPHDPVKQAGVMNSLAYERAREALLRGKQVMVFVHSRKGTVTSARALLEQAVSRGDSAPFEFEAQTGADLRKYHQALGDVAKSRNRELKDLFPKGLAMHHAGMLRADRALVERFFLAGFIRVLVCTATLAWGVNLPAHTVIIKGTSVYNAERGGFADLGMLDVMQIFGRAGRPQFDTAGEGIIITTHEALPRYLTLLTHQLPIESRFVGNLENNLNAEIVLGTVSNMAEAVTWLGYTYMFIRMRRNPLAYGVSPAALESDPSLINHRHRLLESAAKELDSCRMVRYDARTATFSQTFRGRIASYFYIHFETMRLFDDRLRADLSLGAFISTVCQAQEFANIRVRDDEVDELTRLMAQCPLPVQGGAENAHGKVNILLQAYIGRMPLDAFALVSDMNYVSQNAARIFRALFELAVHEDWLVLADHSLRLARMADRQLWDLELAPRADRTFHPLYQFAPLLSYDVLRHLEKRRGFDVDRLCEMTPAELGQIVAHPRMGRLVAALVQNVPAVEVSASAQPITRSILRVTVTLAPRFVWDDRHHGASVGFWVWVEDPEAGRIYHHELVQLTKRAATEPLQLAFSTPISDPLPAQYIVRALADTWMGADAACALPFQHLVLPFEHARHTELLPLRPLPRAAVGPEFEPAYSFKFFNPIQTQLFHVMFHTDQNVLLGAPTSSGKTVVAELAMLRLFRESPGRKVVYVGPLKALVRERVKDWQDRFVGRLGKRLAELTGDFSPDLDTLKQADIVATTPEKWDGISRRWAERSYVQEVGLMIIDEVHLLGADRGPILEVIVSRMRYAVAQNNAEIRFVCLSTAASNAPDVADWLGIRERRGMFNFRPAVRPVPCEAHILGFPGRNYCPRMQTMNRPTYRAIMEHSPHKPVLVFVSSRRQTRLTAVDLVALLAADGNPQRWVHMPDDEHRAVLATVRDAALRQALEFGVGLHHAGLQREDKDIVEGLFGADKIQVLVSTSTLAWGVNLPAHLVVIKGTEFFDGATGRYVDYPITDVLQMMGRAGRPQFDTMAKAVILVHEPKKSFYRKFLYEPFPIESSLHTALPVHLLAEIVIGSVRTRQDAVDYLTWTFLYRRLLANPTYYGVPSKSPRDVDAFLSQLVDRVVRELEAEQCIEVDEEDPRVLHPLTLGRIASCYYLTHTTVGMFFRRMRRAFDVRDALAVLCDASEFAEIPVRHNEDLLNKALAPLVRWPPAENARFDSPHLKTSLLLQSLLDSVPMPISDYYTDRKTVLESSTRVLQAMVDVAADAAWLKAVMSVVALLQMLAEGAWDRGTRSKSAPHITVKCRVDSALLSGGLFDSDATHTVHVDVSSSRPIDASRRTPAWFVVAAEPDADRLLVLRRIRFRPSARRVSARLNLPADTRLDLLHVFLLSDSYFGIDLVASTQGISSFSISSFAQLPPKTPNKKSDEV